MCRDIPNLNDYWANLVRRPLLIKNFLAGTGSGLK